MARLKLHAWGQDREIAFSIDKYANNDNTAIQMWAWVEGCYENGVKLDGYYEPWSTLTVNLPKRKCKPNCAFIDVNNNGDIIGWLEKNNLGFETGVFEISGFCIYPMFEFNMDELKKYMMEDRYANKEM